MKDGGPAFPRPVSEDRTSGDQPDGNSTISEQDGMSLRDHFAGVALQGCLAHECNSLKDPQPVENYARLAYKFADAMLAARESK